MTAPNTRYMSMRDMLDLLPEPNRSACLRLYDENIALFREAQGSSHNHQAWPGGYYDHVTEAMNYAALFYEADLSTGRGMPFSIEDAWLAIFLHDIEKPWRVTNAQRAAMASKESRREFRLAKIADYGIVLPPDVANAIRYAEGEGDDYRPDRRIAGPLAGFVHVMDVYSARVRHDYPVPTLLARTSRPR